MENIDDYWIAVISDEIRFFGKKDEDYRYHLEVLKDYLYTYYDDLAKQVDADKFKTNEEIIVYLNVLNNIVYLHSFGYGLLFIPKNVSEDQIKLLYDLFDSMDKIPIHIVYNLTRKHNGIKPDEIMDSNNDLDNTEFLDKFFSVKPYIKRRVR